MLTLLDGIRVLDLSSVLMGPLAARMLGDMGADVVKVEAPEGDLSRTAGPARNPGMASLFLALNANKRSIVLDLKRTAARDALRRLIADADVLIHSTRSASLEALGLRYEDVAAVRPGIVYCHVKGFLDEGELGGQPAFDDMIQALSGVAALQATIAGEPRFVPMFLADKVCGISAAYALCAALIHQLRTGAGTNVEIPMLETMAAFNMVEHLWGETFVPPLAGTGYPSHASGMRRPQRTKDGHVSLWPVTDRQWHRFFDLVGRPELANDPDLATLSARARNPKAVLALFDDVMPGRTTAEWVALCRSNDLPIAEVNSLPDLFTDTHLDSIGFWSTIAHPTEGMLRTHRLPFSIAPAPERAGRHAPRLDEHGAEILSELGLAAEEIAAVRGSAVQ